MNALRTMARRLAPHAERFDSLAVRERGLVFAGALALVYFGWQFLLMDPLLARGRLASERLAESQRQIAALSGADAELSADPLIAAAARNRALRGRLAALDSELQLASHGYVPPQKMAELLHELLAGQHGLTLVSLKNLPVESLSGAVGATPEAAPAADDRGPYLHPVEMVVDGSYADVIGYLRSLEGMHWRIYWQRLELNSGEYPHNRVRIVVGALSLSRDWISV